MREMRYLLVLSKKSTLMKIVQNLILKNSWNALLVRLSKKGTAMKIV
jgi:hypothetical protein